MLHFHHWLASAAEVPALRFHQLQHHPLSAASSRLPPASTKQRRCGNIVSQALRSTETTMRWRYSVVSVANLTRCQGRQEPRSVGLNSAQSGTFYHMQVRGSDFPRRAHATVGKWAKRRVSPLIAAKTRPLLKQDLRTLSLTLYYCAGALV